MIDRPPPAWWVALMWGSLAFALLNWFHYQVFRSGETAAQAYKRQVITPEALVALSRDASTVRTGRQLFSQTCGTCHAANAGGGIGPNLTDAFWLHGGAPEQIYRTVFDGVPANGMPAWGPQLGAEATQAVTAYVLSLRNTDVPGGKGPQGQREP